MNFPLSFRRAAAFLFTFFFVFNSDARPDMTPLGPNIADKGSAYYHFTVIEFDADDGQRHYRVWTGIPKKTPPAEGFPILYMLDGNAVMDRLSEQLLRKISAKNPPVIVAIGYQTAKPFELNARSYDYTPPVAENGANETLRGRKGGGSTLFRHLLEERIAPLAEGGLEIDPARRGVWGHSLGGIFVLEAYLSSSFFNRYYATSPSLNGKYIGLLNDLAKADPPRFCNKSLYIIEGSGAPEDNPRAPASDIQEKIRATLSRLEAKGLSAEIWPHPGLSHGEMFNAGFEQALLDTARPGEQKRALCR